MKLDISLITPPSSAKAIDAALQQNPYLTSLPTPTADIVSPEILTQTSYTADILRIPEVRRILHGDFLVLPCDLVCELAGELLLEAWMVRQASLAGASSSSDPRGSKSSSLMHNNERQGGLGVWFETNAEENVAGEETDFVITAPLDRMREPAPEGSLVPQIQELVYSTTADTLNDIVKDNGFLPLRQSIAVKHPRTKVLTSFRDAHVYFFPHWVLDLVDANDNVESISEDVLGWWAKAGWQVGLPAKLGLRNVLNAPVYRTEDLDGSVAGLEMDLESLSTTRKSTRRHLPEAQASDKAENSSQDPKIPPFLAYVHSRDPEAPLIRRVDTPALLSYVSLRLAKLEPIEDVGKAMASPFSHASKIAYPAGVATKTTIHKANCLLAENVTVEPKSIIKESVIGANCHIKTGVKLTRCLLMDGAVVGDGSDLTDCIIGNRAQVGNGSTLVNCEVQHGNVVPDETEARGENFMVFRGLDDAGAEAEEDSDAGVDVLLAE